MSATERLAYFARRLRWMIAVIVASAVPATVIDWRVGLAFAVGVTAGTFVGVNAALTSASGYAADREQGGADDA